MNDAPRMGRRQVLLAGLGGSLAGAVGAGSLVGWKNRPEPVTPEWGPAPGVDALTPVDPHGTWQAGIERPAEPQPYALFLVFGGIGRLGPWLRELGVTITAMCSTGEGLLDGGGDLTVTVGLGPSLVAQVAPGAVGSERLPTFAGDELLAEEHRTGDVCVQICGSDPVALDFAAQEVRRVIPGEVSFQQRGFRPPGTGTIVRTPLGFHDGIAVPRGGSQLRESVFVTQGPLAGASVWVVRQFVLDLDGFRRMDQRQREEAVGRRESDGAPLSGGTQMDDVRLGAKRPDGTYLVPTDAHVRRAHPSFTGSGLMLRRSYGYDNGGAESGLIFVSFQNELRTFVATQRRLDEADALLAFATPAASFVFLALPGFHPQRPLGSALI